MQHGGQDFTEDQVVFIRAQTIPTGVADLICRRWVLLIFSTALTIQKRFNLSFLTTSRVSTKCTPSLSTRPSLDRTISRSLEFTRIACSWRDFRRRCHRPRENSSGEGGTSRNIGVKR